MAFPSNIWNQLKNITASELANALRRDGWTEDAKGGSQIIFWKAGRRVSVHMHPHKTYGAKTLQGLLADIGWTEADLRRLKLVR